MMAGIFIPDPDPRSESWFFTHPGSRGQKAPDPGFEALFDTLLFFFVKLGIEQQLNHLLQ
jgi:hypothetical protein